MSDFDRVSRYLGMEAMAQLAEKTVAVVGLGSGGGFAALTLAMSGVGGFILIDPDIVEAKNAVRHVADLRDVGRTKVEAVADLIRARNPNARIQTIAGKFEDHADALQGVDLVVSGVDAERPKYVINERARALDLTVVYAGVYERGEGGDVVVIHPTGPGACYACWALQLREGVIDQGTGETALDYGQIGADGTLAAEPSLWLHVVRVAAAQADLALNELLVGTPAHREMPGNTVILANVEMEIFADRKTRPYSAEWITIARDPTCLVCGTNPEPDILSLENLLGNERGNER